MAVLLTGPAALEAGPGLPHKTWTRDEIKVLQSTGLFDLTAKASLYARAGFPDYWVADLNGRTLHVLRDPVDGDYRTHLELGESASVEPLAAPGHSIRIADLLP